MAAAASAARNRGATSDSMRMGRLAESPITMMRSRNAKLPRAFGENYGWPIDVCHEPAAGRGQGAQP